MPELDNSKPPLFVPSKRSYNDFVLAWRGHSRKRNYSQLLEWAENPDNAPEALTQQQQTWNSRFFSDLVDSLYNGETDDAATAALAAMDAAADDGMQLWTALKREIDITLPSARSHAEDQLKTKTKQKHDETVAEFGLRFRGAVREFKNRGGEMTNYKYAELFAANVHERHQRIALELVTDLDPDDDNAIIIPDIIRRTNERASLHDRIIRANPENRRRRLALPVQGRGGGRNGGRTGGRGGRNTERFDPQRHNRRCQNANCPAPHTHDTPMCYAPGGARHDPARWRGNTDAGRGGRGGRGGYQGGRGGRGGRHPLQYTPQPQHYTPQQHQNFQQLGGAYTTYPAYPVLATDASHHGIGGTQQYLPPPPPLPSQLMQNNIARVGEAFPTMNAPPPTGQMYQTGPYRRTFAITLATNEPNCSKYIVDNASPYTLTGSLNHLYDVQQLEKPKEIGGIKKDSTIKCTHVGKIDFTTHEGTLTVSNAYYGFYFGQIDVETAYLYALVQELIYMRPPKGTNYGPNKICRLLKSLYGLKQAGRNWYLDLKDYLVELGFKPGEVDIGMYSAAVGTENEIWILVYVDDIIFASKNEQTKDIFAGHLRKKYRITEPAQLTWALGMKISFAADGIILTQDLYMSKILERFGFTSAAKSATTPLAHGTTLTRADEEDAEARHLAQQFVGAILYAAVISRPDLSSTVRAMSHVMSKPPSNFEACKKHVLRYLSGTINRGIKYNTNSNVPLKLIGYCDASWGDNHENRRSTSGYIFFLNGGPISWASYLQTTVALSTVESEVMALTEAIKEAIYIRRLLESLGAAQEGPTIIYTDSTGAEALVDHPTSHRRTKHIEIRREFIKFHIGHETVKIERVSTKDQLADILTKPLRQDIHNYLVQMILHG
ncbi:retrovirus-related Pol polyprotein [Pseudoscourfieldia marina]